MKILEILGCKGAAEKLKLVCYWEGFVLSALCSTPFILKRKICWVDMSPCVGIGKEENLGLKERKDKNKSFGQ